MSSEVKLVELASNKDQVVLDNKKGNVKLLPDTSAEISFKIPPALSALGMMSHNEVFDGEVFAEDFYVYKDNKRIRKWFSHCEGWNHFWEPILLDIKRLEEVYYRLTLRSVKRSQKLWDHVKRIMDTTEATTNKFKEKAWLVHAQPYLKQHQIEGCWLYDIHMGFMDKTKPSYSTSAVELPKNFSHLELGNQMYHLENLSKPYLMVRMGLALDMAFKKFLRGKFPGLEKSGHSNKMVELLVNGRHYIYNLQLNGYGSVVWEKHLWPGDEYQIVEV